MIGFTYTTPKSYLIHKAIRVEYPVPASIMRVAKQWSFYQSGFYKDIFLDLDVLLSEFGDTRDFSLRSEPEKVLYKYIQAAYDDGVWILVFNSDTVEEEE